jgi:hypothetical protein
VLVCYHSVSSGGGGRINNSRMTQSSVRQNRNCRACFLRHSYEGPEFLASTSVAILGWDPCIKSGMVQTS